jgi:Inclusion body protein
MTTLENPRSTSGETRDDTDTTVRVLIIIDAETLLRDYQGQKGTKDKPINLAGSANKYISMLVRSANATEYQKSSDLAVSLAPEQDIQWRETSLSLNTRYATMIYGFHKTGGDAVLSTPEPRVTEIEIPLPNLEKKPGEIVWDKQEVQDYYWKSDANKYGHENYAFDFVVLDNRSFKEMNYFTWDPSVTNTKP